MPDLRTCPHCHADLSNGRTVGVKIWGVYDGALFWRCPDCGGSWHRFWFGHQLHEKAERHVGSPEKAAAEKERP